MHNPGEVADMKDVEGCIELIAEFYAVLSRRKAFALQSRFAERRLFVVYLKKK